MSEFQQQHIRQGDKRGGFRRNAHPYPENSGRGSHYSGRGERNVFKQQKPMKKEDLLWQRFANFKLLLTPTSSTSFDEPYLQNVDTPAPWNRVEHIVVPRTLNEFCCDSTNISSVGSSCRSPAPSLDTRSHKCPICLLENCYVPRITKCGHMFCFVCIVKFMDGQIEAKCPVCSETVLRDDWRAVSTLSAYQEYQEREQGVGGVGNRSMAVAAAAAVRDATYVSSSTDTEKPVRVGQVVTAQLFSYHPAPKCTVEYVPSSTSEPEVFAVTMGLKMLTNNYFLPSSWSYLLHHTALELELLELFLVECRSCGQSSGTGEGLYGHSNADPCWVSSINECTYLLREYRNRCQRELAASATATDSSVTERTVRSGSIYVGSRCSSSTDACKSTVVGENLDVGVTNPISALASSEQLSGPVRVPLASPLLRSLQLCKPFNFGGGGGGGGGQLNGATLYYQLPATQEFWCFLHPLTVSAICYDAIESSASLAEFASSLRPAESEVVVMPRTIVGSVLQIEHVVVSPATRRRYPFLCVVPLHCTVSIVELDVYSGRSSGSGGGGKSKKAALGHAPHGGSSSISSSSSNNNDCNSKNEAMSTTTCSISAKSLEHFKTEIQHRVRGREALRKREKRDQLEQEDARLAHSVYVEQVKETHRERENSRRSMVKELLSGPVVGHTQKGDDSSVDHAAVSSGSSSDDINSSNNTTGQPSAKAKFSFANIAQMGGNFPTLSGEDEPPLGAIAKSSSGSSAVAGSGNCSAGRSWGRCQDNDVVVGMARGLSAADRVCGGAWQVLSSPSSPFGSDSSTGNTAATSTSINSGKKSKASKEKCVLSNTSSRSYR